MRVTTFAKILAKNSQRQNRMNWLSMSFMDCIGFVMEYHRNPSRHRIEEHDHLNWLKANRKVMNKGDYRI